MDPESVNRFAMWGTIGLLAIAGVVFATTWASGSNSDPPGEAALGPETASIPGSFSNAGETLEPLESINAGDLAPTTPPSSTSEAETIATASASTTTAPTPSSREVASATGTTSGVAESTTTTAAGSTTLPPAASTTTTTLPTTTSTTRPATTTTTVPTTTSTTRPPTTTTTSPVASDRPALFVQRFDAHANGDDDNWQIEVDVGLGGTVAGSYRGQVRLAWTGSDAGSTILNTGGSGKATATIGSFTGDAITVAITGVDAATWAYDPRLNQTATSLTIQPPVS